jgi:hypothetical protein
VGRSVVEQPSQANYRPACVVARPKSAKRRKKGARKEKILAEFFGGAAGGGLIRLFGPGCFFRERCAKLPPHYDSAVSAVQQFDSLLSPDGSDRRASGSLLATETGQGGPGYDESSELSGKNNPSIPVDEAMAECRFVLRGASRAVCGKYGL